MIGKTLGHYNVLDQLGAGGMGEVYLATDTHLGRQVAIKILPEAFANDPERVARFAREAQVLSQLNHANIASIYGFEEHDGRRFLVLEYVPGETLKGPLPIDDALRIARQLAEALEAAHERGITHRDLKPANIRVTPEGKVKVLDFGLAKALAGEAAASDTALSPTLSALATRAGTILGTAAYMSPEQARGRGVDRRTDIWAFGCVLYEMLAGKQAFPAETVSDAIAGILAREPDWGALPPATPERVRELLRRCLRKDLAKRLRHIDDVPFLLDELPAEPLPPNTQHPAPNTRVPWVVGALGLALGARLAFIAGSPRRIHLRLMDQLEVKPIAGTDNAIAPFFSPDGQWIGFFQDRKLKKVQVVGGATMTLCDNCVGSNFGGGASWGLDGNIILGGIDAGLSKVSGAGGTPQVLTTPDAKKGETDHR